MSRPVKTVCYILLLAAALVFGLRARSSYKVAAAAPGPAQRTNAPLTAGRLSLEKTEAKTQLWNNAGALFGVFLLFSLLLARDIAQWFGQRAENFVAGDKGEGLVSPEYDHVEEVWADGRYLEAIELLREFLKRHPREQYAAIRIAEIYEADLQSPLAAALEYEEVLKKKLPPERWGWTAIHLANLYSGKLEKTDQAIALLRRIDQEYGQTAAAKKARERLGVSPVPEEAVAPEPAPEEKPGSSLPPGFRPFGKS